MMKYKENYENPKGIKIRNNLWRYIFL